MGDRRERLIAQRNRVDSWGNIVKSRLRAVLQYAGRSILDVGCAHGAYVQRLRALGYTAYGCDLLPSAEWTKYSPPSFCVGDIGQLPFKNNSVDTVLAFEVLEHLKEPSSALQELQRVSRKNIIISVPNCERQEILEHSGLAFHHWTDATHQQFFTLESLRDILLAADLEIQFLGYINPIAPDKLFLATWRLPFSVCSALGHLGRKLPLRRKFFMSLLAVACKRPDQ